MQKNWNFFKSYCLHQKYSCFYATHFYFSGIKYYGHFWYKFCKYSLFLVIFANRLSDTFVCKNIVYFCIFLHKYWMLQNRYNVLLRKSEFAGKQSLSCKICRKCWKNTPSFVKKDGVKNFSDSFSPKKGIKEALQLSFLPLFPQGKSPFRGNLHPKHNAKLLSS